MELKGKVHCFFEQSGTFKNEFKKLGYYAEDYDIQNNFGETDYVIDLFKEINNAYDEKESIFDSFSKDDLIVAFFPCIYFCDSNNLYFEDVSINLSEQFKNNYCERYKLIYERSEKRQYFYGLLWKLVCIIHNYNLRLIIENPYNTNGVSYLQRNFIKPTIIDNNRMLRGDYFKKPTAYWFFNCEPTHGFTEQNDKKQKSVYNLRGSGQAGLCSEERSMISSDYARNWICDFILGKKQNIGQLQLF